MAEVPRSAKLRKPVLPFAPMPSEYAEKTKRKYIYSFSENFQEEDWDEEDEDCDKEVPEKPIDEVDLGWLLSKLPEGVKPSDVKIEFGYYASCMAYEDHWVRFYYEVTVPTRMNEYKAAKEKYDKDMAKYKKDMKEYKEVCRQEEIKEAEAKLAKLKRGE